MLLLLLLRRLLLLLHGAVPWGSWRSWRAVVAQGIRSRCGGELICRRWQPLAGRSESRGSRRSTAVAHGCPRRRSLHTLIRRPWRTVTGDSWGSTAVAHGRPSRCLQTLIQPLIHPAGSHRLPCCGGSIIRRRWTTRIIEVGRTTRRYGSGGRWRSGSPIPLHPHRQRKLRKLEP